MTFDPYETWLGIPADRRPPTHYDLLGLAPSESDPATIDQAALRRMSKVRQHQIGPYSDQSQEILAELARARLILMDPDRRADYDAKLRAQGEARPGLLVAQDKDVHGQAPQPRLRRDGDASGVIAALALTNQVSDGPSRLSDSPSKRAPWWKNPLLISAIVASHALVLGAFYYGVFAPLLSQQKPANPVQVNTAPPTPPPNRRPPVPVPKFVDRSRPDPHQNVQPPQESSPGGGGERSAPHAAFSSGEDRDIRDLSAGWQGSESGMLPDPGGGTEPPPRKGGAGQRTLRKKDQNEVAEAGKPSQVVLAQHKLSLHESRYLLEGDTDLVEAEKKARRLDQVWRNAVAKAESTRSPEAHGQEREIMINEIHRLTEEIDRLNQELGKIDRAPGGRFANNGVAAQFQALVDTRDQDHLTRQQISAALGRFDRQPFDSRDRQRADDLAKQKADEYERARGDFERLFDETAEKTNQEYKELNENKEIQKALELLGKTTKVKLGPSKQFEQIVKHMHHDELQKQKGRSRKK